MTHKVFSWTITLCAVALGSWLIGDAALSQQAPSAATGAQAGGQAAGAAGQADVQAEAGQPSAETQAAGQAQTDQAAAQADANVQAQQQAQPAQPDQAQQDQAQQDQVQQDAQQQPDQQAQQSVSAQGDLGLELSAEGEAVRISTLEQNSVFAEAGLQANDEIISVGGRRFNDAAQLQTYLRQATGEVPIIVRRNGQEETIMVRMEDEFAAQASPSDRPRGQARRGDQRPGLGVTFDGSRRDTVIIRVVSNSPASDAGLREGDRVAQVDGRQHDGPFATAMAIHRMNPGQQLTLTVERGGQEQQLQATLATWQEAFAQADFRPVPAQVALQRMQQNQRMGRLQQAGPPPAPQGDEGLAAQHQDDQHTVLRPQLDDQQNQPAGDQPRLEQDQNRQLNQSTPSLDQTDEQAPPAPPRAPGDSL